MDLWKQIIIAMVFGIICGLLAPAFSVEYLSFFGVFFIKLIKMLVVPLVFTSVIAGITHMEDTKTLGKMGGIAVLTYMCTTCFAIVLGLVMAHVIEPGSGVNLDGAESFQMPEGEARSVGEIILALIPSNPIGAIAEGNMLQMLFFAIFLGVAAAALGKVAKPFVAWNEACAHIMIKMTGWIMKVTPYGVAGLVAKTVATQGIEIFASLSLLVFTFFITALLHVGLVYGGLLVTIVRMSPFSFIKRAANALLLAFSTSSSSATLPVTMQTARNKLKYSEHSTSFVLPLGATINMDGTALYQGICVVFIAQAMGIDLTTMQLATVVLTATLASIGTAGIPSAGIIMLGTILTSIGLPLDAVGLILAIDRVLDMIRTAINVSGDLVVTGVVDRLVDFDDDDNGKK